MCGVLRACMIHCQAVQRWWFCTLCVAASLLAVGPGCRKSPPSARVVGTVSLNGKTVTSGDVVIVAADGRSSPTGRVRADGSYMIDGAPIGHVKVGFFNPPPPPLPAAATGPDGGDEELRQMREVARLCVATPAKYADPAHSGIVFELKAGANECNIELK